MLLAGDTDFIGLAQTGTGKTAAFGIPLLARVNLKNKHVQSLVLAPTRELGKQIAEQLEQFSSEMRGVNVLTVYGGAPIQRQIAALKKKPQIIVATPGRLIDLINRRAVKLSDVETVVLDEADEMLNMGFRDELNSILEHTPFEKSTWLFSATMPAGIREIISEYMDNPQEVAVSAGDVNADIEHLYVEVNRNLRPEALERFVRADAEIRGIVFCRTKRDTVELSEILGKKGLSADALNGDLSQHQRDRVMRRFRERQIQILVATDVAARGIDVNDLTHIFHFNIPEEAASYTHRSGRTARAGKQGKSIIFIGFGERYKIRRLEKGLKIDFEKVLVPQQEDVAMQRIQSWCMDTLNQKPKSKVQRDHLDLALMLYTNLSREELLAKLISRELQSLDLGNQDDLNQDFRSKKGSGKPQSRQQFKGRDRKRPGSHFKSRRSSSRKQDSPYPKSKKRFSVNKKKGGRK